MSADQFLNPSDAAKRLGVSAKALRLYEQRDLVQPLRTAAGWRAYGPDQMKRAAEIVALRSLGLSLSQIARVLNGDAAVLEQALAGHQSALECQLRETSAAIEKVHALRNSLASGRAPDIADLARLQTQSEEVVAAFDLPWPWGGERFELRDIKAINFIVGPLFSGKTKLALRIAETLSNAEFVGLDRLPPTAPLSREAADALTWLLEDGATRSDALVALLARLESAGSNALVIDMIEQGLNEDTQTALIARLRRRGPRARPLFLLTRSSAILDLTSVGPQETILFCPANHSPPIRVAPYLYAPGYEAVASCLAPPDIRARTEGVIAFRPAS